MSVGRNLNINDTPLTVCHLYWQGLKDDYQTYCGIVSFSKGSKDNA